MNKKFASLGTAISRDEAKKVMGGKLAGGSGGTIICTVTWNSGYPVPDGTPHKNDYYCMGLTPNECQAVADDFCMSGPYADNCTTIDCPGAD